jgi:hypothetical protein
MMLSRAINGQIGTGTEALKAAGCQRFVQPGILSPIA